MKYAANAAQALLLQGNHKETKSFATSPVDGEVAPPGYDCHRGKKFLFLIFVWLPEKVGKARGLEAGQLSLSSASTDCTLLCKHEGLGEVRFFVILKKEI